MNLSAELKQFEAALPDHLVDANEAEVRLLEAQSEYETVGITLEHFRGGDLSETENELLQDARRAAAKLIALRAFLLWCALSKKETKT